MHRQNSWFHHTPAIALLIALAGCAPRVQVHVETPPSDTANVQWEDVAALNNALQPANAAVGMVGPVNLDRPLSACPVPPNALGPMQPIPWSLANGPQRWGYGVTRADQIRSSPAVPVEVCGVRGQTSWLVNLVCPDGSRPFASHQQAHAARRGNVGAGGRCGTVVDRYQVACSTGVYDVFMDLYHCTPTESFR